jgi:hypothetical protein
MHTTATTNLSYVSSAKVLLNEKEGSIANPDLLS